MEENKRLREAIEKKVDQPVNPNEPQKLWSSLFADKTAIAVQIVNETKRQESAQKHREQNICIAGLPADLDSDQLWNDVVDLRMDLELPEMTFEQIEYTANKKRVIA